jgi:hypothetical protein
MASTVNVYEELKLRIAPADSGGFRVLATSVVGEASGWFSMPLSDLEVENFVLRVSRARGRRRIDSPATEEAKRIGGNCLPRCSTGTCETSIERHWLGRRQRAAGCASRCA